MQHKIVLAYNFSAQRLQQLKIVCMLVKAKCVAVPYASLNQPVGYLAGVKGVEPAQAAYEGTDVLAEMLFLCGFDRPSLDRLLAAIKKSPLQKVDLKAMLTSHNVTWSGIELLKELTEEHEYMTANYKKQPPEHIQDSKNVQNN